MAAIVSDSRLIGRCVPLFVIHFLFADKRCADGCTAADKQQDDPQSEIACVTGLGRIRVAFARVSGRCFTAARSSLDLKLRAALTVVIDDGQGVLTDGKRVKVIVFQRYHGRAGHGSVFIRSDERTVNLDADELGEISVCNEFQRCVGVLRPRAVCPYIR